MTNPPFPSKSIAIVKVIAGIFAIGIAMLFIIMGIPDKLNVALFAIMGVISLVGGIGEFYLAKRERKT